MNKLIFASIAMLIIAIFSMPYGYYQLLRLVITVMAGVVSYKCYKKDNLISPGVILLGLILLLYNPICKIYFEREVWQVINVITALILAIYLNRNKSNG